MQLKLKKNVLRWISSEKKVIIDERWVFNFFPAKMQDRKELNVTHGLHCGLFLFCHTSLTGHSPPEGYWGCTFAT